MSQMKIDLQKIEAQARAWDEIMKMAERSGLISQAGGGIATLIHPRTQMEHGVYCKIQYSNLQEPHPRRIIDAGAGVYYCRCSAEDKSCWREYLSEINK